MIRTLAGLALVSTVLSSPAFAQGRETEFGADVAIKWMKASGGGNGVFYLQTPVDVRIAFHTAGRIAIEPRFTALFVSSSGHNAYTFDPGLNVLFGFPGSASNDGAYFTVGADMPIAGGTGLSSESYFSLNAGLGLRRPMGRAASRTEIFIGYTPKQGTTILESIITVGARLGLSFFN